MKKILVMFCLCVALGSSAMAQSEKGKDDGFKFALIAYNTTVAADTATTLGLLSKGGFREANPALSPFQDEPLKLAGIKIGVAVGSTYALIKLHEHKPKLAFWLTIAAIGVNGFAAAHNARRF